MNNKQTFKAVKLLFWGAAFAIFLSACTHSNTPQRSRYSKHPILHFPSADLKCNTPQLYANKIVGDGHCVSLIKQCANAPSTNLWRPGDYVLQHQNQLPLGSIIATFKNGRYPNRTGYHAAIYISHDDSGIWVWDQWIGKPVHRRLIKNRHDRADAGNTAQEYRIVKIH